MPSHEFQPGTSGNPSGRRRGSKNRATLLRTHLVTSDSVRAIAGTLVESALAGNVQAAVAVLDRVWPRLRSSAAPIQIDLPDGSLTEQGRAVLAAVSAGAIDAETGSRLLTGIGALARVAELDELTRRVDELERRDGT
jgi:hypothetical protein